jgi:Zn-dependent protease with chaperone function
MGLLQTWMMNLAAALSPLAMAAVLSVSMRAQAWWSRASERAASLVSTAASAFRPDRTTRECTSRTYSQEG